MAHALQQRRVYDHRLRDQVCKAGAVATVHRLAIPRSTVATWRSRGPRPVVTLAAFDQDREELVARIEKLEARAGSLAAVVRLLLALLRVSGFRLAGGRLPDGAAKATILGAVDRALPALPLGGILHVLGLPASRYHAWRRAAVGCGLEDRSACPRISPQQVGVAEGATIKDMVLDPALRHMPVRTLSR